jgi:hypothetical protein
MIDRAMAEINAQYRLTKDFLKGENTFFRRRTQANAYRLPPL